MIRTKILFATFLLFLFVLLAASASAFNVQTNLLTNVVCPSSTIVIEEKVTATKDSKFQILLDGTAASFATVLPPSFVLNKNETTSVYVYLTPSSMVVPGNYNLGVIISDGIESKRVTHEIVVENCNKLLLSVEAGKDVCACEAKVYKAKIKNTGFYRERYKLEIFGNAAKFAKLSIDQIALSPNEEKDFLVYFNPSCSLKEDGYTFTLKATSLDSRAIATASGDIRVKNCYSYELDAEKNFYSLCDGENGKAKFFIDNRGASENTYDINIKGPSWAKLEKTSVILPPKTKGEVNISLKPKLGEKEGNYTIEIQTLSQKGEILGKEIITAEVKECHGASLEILFDKEKDKLCNALTNTYGVELKNTGEKEGDYALTLNAPSWVRLKNITTAKLAPNATVIFTLEASPSHETKSDEYKVKIVAKDRNSEIKASDELTIETFTKEECYRPKITATKESVEVEKDKTEVVILTIENTGARKADYIIDASGSATRFVSITPSILEIEPQKAKSTYVYIAPSIATPNGSYTITVAARLNDSTMLESKTIAIEVVDKAREKKEELNISLAELEMIEEEKSWWDKVKDWFKNLFGKKVEENVNKANEANDSILESLEQLEKTEKNEVSSFKEFLSKYRYEFIASLVIILIILVLILFDFWPKRKKEKNI
ncbi:MAG: hypothetical protein QW622_02050 [Candidatus Pacearchaeota archaeon]